jgi:hypothetical protein
LAFLGHRKNEFLRDGMQFVDDDIYISLGVYSLLHEMLDCTA